jgi:DNA-binding GntR family transcriptional regulator
MVRRALRQEIVSLQRRPSDPISEKDIAAAYGISRTPVREALLRLSEEGLVEIVPYSGTRVARIPVWVLPDAMFARSAIEQAVARAAARRARGSEVTALRGLIERQREALEQNELGEFHEADETFHAAIATAARLPGVWDMVMQLKAQLDRYRKLTLPEAGRMARVAEEHAVIVDAIAAQDCDGAAAAMRKHLDGLRLSLSAIRNHNPDYFTDDAAGISAALEKISFE